MSLSRCYPAGQSADGSTNFFVLMSCDTDDASGSLVKGVVYLDAACTVKDTKVPTQPVQSVYEVLGGGTPCSLDPSQAQGGFAALGYISYTCLDVDPLSPAAQGVSSCLVGQVGPGVPALDAPVQEPVPGVLPPYVCTAFCYTCIANATDAFDGCQVNQVYSTYGFMVSGVRPL